MSEVLDGQVADVSVTPESEEGHVDEAIVNGEQVAATSGESTPYTDEEAAAILESGGNLDSKRLSPTQRLVQQSFEKHYTKGYQEVADMKKSLERLVEAQKPKDPLDGWVDGYIADPVTATMRMQNIIADIKFNMPDKDIDPEGYRAAMGRLITTESDVEMVKARARHREVTQSRLQTIPQDFKDFAKSKGFDENALLDPKISDALKNLHKYETAGKALKPMGKQPSQVVAPGAGLPSAGKTQEFNRFKKAADSSPTTDNIAALIAAKRKLQT